jgi:putative FmdB family regulatory protein
MPTYNYDCQNEECGHTFELFQQMSGRIKRKCPECGILSLVRLIGRGGGVIFRGDGFFSKDYGGKNASDGSN